MLCSPARDWLSWGRPGPGLGSPGGSLGNAGRSEPGLRVKACPARGHRAHGKGWGLSAGEVQLGRPRGPSRSRPTGSHLHVVVGGFSLSLVPLQFREHLLSTYWV